MEKVNGMYLGVFEFTSKKTNSKMYGHNVLICQSIDENGLNKPVIQTIFATDNKSVGHKPFEKIECSVEFRENFRTNEFKRYYADFEFVNK